MKVSKNGNVGGYYGSTLRQAKVDHYATSFSEAFHK